MSMSYSLKISKYGQRALYTRTSRIRPFLEITRSINWKDRDLKVYVKVCYGKKLDIYDQLSVFYNDGDYDNKEEFNLAFKAFREEEAEWKTPC